MAYKKNQRVAYDIFLTYAMIQYDWSDYSEN